MFQVLGQLVTVDETQAIIDKGDKIDMRFNTTKKYDLQFFYLSSLSCWFCKVYRNFAPLGNQQRLFIEVPWEI